MISPFDTGDVRIYCEPMEYMFSIGCYSYPERQENNCTRPYKDRPTTSFLLFRAQEYERTWFMGLIQAAYPYLKQWGRQYVVLSEASSAPIEHGFLARCRYLSSSDFERFYSLNRQAADVQKVTAIDAMCAFIEDEIAGYHKDGMQARLQQRYGAYNFYVANGLSSDASLGLGFGLLQERGGTIRLWSRVLYYPQ